MIDKEFLENEIQTLTTQREHHLAAANAAGGAIEGFRYLITQLETKDPLTFKDLENLTGMKVEGIKNAKEEEKAEEVKRSKE